MVNPGHASTGCATCRSRRIKCDEAFPTCARCARSKRVCLGYDSQLPKSNSQPRLMMQRNVEVEQHHEVDCKFFIATAVVVGDVRIQSAYWNGKLQSMLQSNPNASVNSTLEIIKDSFRSLKEPSQTSEVRQRQHERYGTALRAFREDLSSSSTPSKLLLPAFFFALYEMIVHVASDGSTCWQTHLDGLLALDKSSESTNSHVRLPMIASTLCTLDSHLSAAEFMAIPEGDSLPKALSLLAITTLRLRALVVEMDVLFTSSERPRKLLVEKFRQSVRHIHRDVTSLPSILPKWIALDRNFSAEVPRGVTSAVSLPWPTHDTEQYTQDFLEIIVCDQYMTLLIITSSLLLKTGEYLRSSTVGISYEKTKEHRDLSRLIQVAVDGICASTDVYLRNKSEGPPGLHGTFEVTSTEMLHALLAMWPLYCAYQARGISAHQQEWIRNVLWDVGAREYIPKLMSFTTETTLKSENSVFSEVLGGLLMVGFLLRSK